MVAVTRNPFSPRGAVQKLSWCAVLSLLTFALNHAMAREEEQAPEDGLFISISNPITTGVVNRVKAKTDRALQRTDRRYRKIIYDFNPGNQPSGTRDYGPCRDLAAFILEKQEITTVAFVHNEVTGHTILPVLACKEIVMSTDAKLGDVLRDQSKPLDPDQVQFYETIAAGRGRCPAIILKMLDKDAEIVEASRAGAVWYVDRRKQAKNPEQGVIVTRQDPVLPAGNAGFYSAAQAQKFTLSDHLKETRQEVAEAYQLSASSLREDPLEGRAPVAERIVIRERINKALSETLQRRIRQAISRGANFILLQLEGGGGDTEVAWDLAEFLHDRKDDKGEFSVMTVAYIPERAPDAATILALGCTEIVMRKSAEIGDFENVIKRRPDSVELVRKSLMQLASDQGYSPLLAQGMLDRNVAIYHVESQKGKSESKFITEKELHEDLAGPQQWGHKILVKPGGPNGTYLKLNGTKAKEWGLAREVVDDLPGVYALYELEHVRDAGFDFLYELASFLRHPLVEVFLVMLGIACLILELKMPGVGLPGVIAALCFVLYFWAQSQLAGQITMLAVLLFVLGLILIGLEIFVLPGFTVCGISGIVLVVVSLALATLEKKPETSQEWLSFGRTIGTVGISLAGAVVLALVAAWYLPSIPYANRLVLKPPADGEEGVEGEFPGQDPAYGPSAEAVALLGAIGVAATTLRPAGIARFGDNYVDVVTEGSFISAGERVQVIEVEGNRVVVKEV